MEKPKVNIQASGFKTENTPKKEEKQEEKK
jgi:hypothetical protein